MSDTQSFYEEGLAEGRKGPFGIYCPYDGRTKAGKEWWRGFVVGDAEWCAKRREEVAKS